MEKLKAHEDKCRNMAWEDVKKDCGLEGLTVADEMAYYGFFCHGWSYKRQFDEQFPSLNNALRRVLNA